MKLIKTASGKTQVKISKVEWQSIGIKKGWMRTAQPAGYAGYGENITPEEDLKNQLYGDIRRSIEVFIKDNGGDIEDPILMTKISDLVNTVISLT